MCSTHIVKGHVEHVLYVQCMYSTRTPVVRTLFWTDTNCNSIVMRSLDICIKKGRLFLWGTKKSQYHFFTHLCDNCTRARIFFGKSNNFYGVLTCFQFCVFLKKICTCILLILCKFEVKASVQKESSKHSLSLTISYFHTKILLELADHCNWTYFIKSLRPDSLKGGSIHYCCKLRRWM